MLLLWCASSALVLLQVSGQEYELWLSPDSSTDGHTQWYFFSIANGRAKVPYRLHIHNFRKAHSLYGQGLQPLLHSSKEASLTVSCLRATFGLWKYIPVLQRQSGQ